MTSGGACMLKNDVQKIEGGCTTCTTSGCGGEPCPRLERQLPGNSTTREITLPTSHLGLLARTVEIRHGMTWESVQTAVCTPLPQFGGLSVRDMDLLRRAYEDGADHNTLAEEFETTPGYVRVALTRIRHRLGGMITPWPKV